MTGHEVQIDALIQVRLTSSRVRRKALVTLGDDSCLGHIIKRLGEVQSLSNIVICTSVDETDEPLERFGSLSGVPVFRGEPDDCITRFLDAAFRYGSDVIVRVPGDSPLVSATDIEAASRFLIEERLDYVWTPSLPVGASVELFTSAALERAALTALDRGLSDDITHFVRRPEINRIGEYQPPPNLRRPEYVLALNRPVDLEVLTELFESAPRSSGYVTLEDAINYLDAHPDLAARNASYTPKPTRCDTRLDSSRLPARPVRLPWYAPVGPVEVS